MKSYVVETDRQKYTLRSEKGGKVRLIVTDKSKARDRQCQADGVLTSGQVVDLVTALTNAMRDAATGGFV